MERCHLCKRWGWFYQHLHRGTYVCGVYCAFFHCSVKIKATPVVVWCMRHGSPSTIITLGLHLVIPLLLATYS